MIPVTIPVVMYDFCFVMRVIFAKIVDQGVDHGGGNVRFHEKLVDERLDRVIGHEPRGKIEMTFLRYGHEGNTGSPVEG